MRPRSAEIMVDRLLSRPEMVAALKSDPEETLRQAARDTVVNFPLGDNPGLFRQVILFLGSTVILVAVGTILLAFIPFVAGSTRIETPESLVALGSVALGALAGLLAPAPQGR